MTGEAGRARALEETTDRLRRAQKAGRIGTWDWDVVTNDLIWDGVEEVHGLPEGSFGGTFEGYLRDMHPEDQGRVLDAIATARDTGTDLQIEYRIVLGDGSVRWVIGRGTCFRDESGQTVRMSGTCQDITYSKLAEQHKEDLFAFASHELRNPLTTILGYARLLERRLIAEPDSFDELTRDAIRDIRQEGDRMAEILNTFLDLARAEARHLEVETEELDVAELLTDEVERLRPKHQAATIEASVPPGPVTVVSDIRRLRRVVSNILDNAIKYGGRPARVVVTCEQRAGYVEIRFRDNGAGVSEEDRRHLFSRFYRGSAWAGTSKGLGIGLYLSRQFIEQLGGRLELASPPGQDTEFLLVLPVRSANAQQAQGE